MFRQKKGSFKNRIASYTDIEAADSQFDFTVHLWYFLGSKICGKTALYKT